MKVIRGLVLSFLGLLLFLSLSAFGIAFMVKSTLLNPEFVASEVDNIDISSLSREIIEEQFSAQLPDEASFIEEFLKEAVYAAIARHEPLIKAQINDAIYDGYDFLLGKSERLGFTVSLEPLAGSIKEDLKQSLMQSLPPQLSVLPPAMIEQYFDQYYQDFAAQIPLEIEIDEGYIPPEVMAQIIRVREGIGYFQTGYNVLIGFMLLLILGIVLINRNIRSITRELGVIFLIYGAIEYAGIFVARQFIPTSLPLTGIPSSLQMWLVGLFSGLLAPLQMFSLVCAVGGVVLLAVSFIFKPRLAEE